MKITVQYYALLREKRGVTSETIETKAATAEQLYAELKAVHNFRLTTKDLRVAVNNEFSSWDKPLADGDSIIFIPPVAGG